ncbi:PIN domain nuclease [Chitinimonas arctica]|uniref:PIN domain nuclease n=1 Tax=Chitinimonas arctica TaxID=2594795 RepID=A0A516SH03_9NEIS|nr:PIN domain nuclease [Chitinimonas arctica]QDQ27412.1 PIN domain nuclease [Chitinimonas arctica]
MTFVDSSVWIDYLRGVKSPQTECLDRLLGEELLVIGDVVLAEVLQGCVSDREFNHVRQILTELDVVTVGGEKLAIQAAMNFRSLRALGVTVRKTIDVLIATCCIEHGYTLLHSDRDFVPFETHLGLRCINFPG